MYQKPMPDECIYRHLQMLINYLDYSAEYDRVEKRKHAKERMRDLLKHVANSRAMITLMDYCE